MFYIIFTLSPCYCGHSVTKVFLDGYHCLLQELVVGILCDGKLAWEAKCESLQLLLSLQQLSCFQLSYTAGDRLWHHLMACIDREVNSQPAALALALSALLIKCRFIIIFTFMYINDKYFVL